MRPGTVHLLVTGSLSITDARIVDFVLNDVMAALGGRNALVRLVHGGARGVDRLAADWAKRQDLESMQIDPENPPVATSYLTRDRLMVDRDATHVVAIWDGQSHGTAHTMNYARKRGKLHACYRAAHVAEELGLRYKDIDQDAS